uniref:SCP domain-containing protein n=1 Tax=Mesocestoides corti TaxID=53468 RepID=A0A5K3F7L8_MESCO
MEMERGLISLLALICLATAEIPSEEERHLIVEGHTKIREGVSPCASNMKLMKYSKKLEALAKKSLTECVVRRPNVTVKFHNETQNMRLYFERKPTYLDMIFYYATEARSYDFDTNTCSGDCAGYKRIVWADSTRVGCAMHKCGYLGPGRFRPIYSVICQYDPMEGIEKKRPYRKGPSCSKCPPGYGCRYNQCVRRREHA